MKKLLTKIDRGNTAEELVKINKNIHNFSTLLKKIIRLFPTSMIPIECAEQIVEIINRFYWKSFKSVLLYYNYKKKVS